MAGTQMRHRGFGLASSNSFLPMKQLTSIIVAELLCQNQHNRPSTVPQVAVVGLSRSCNPDDVARLPDLPCRSSPPG